MYQQLRDASLFRPCTSQKDVSVKQALYPAAGLTAVRDQDEVLIVHTFQRRNVWMAHVVPIIATQAKDPPQGAEAVLQRRRASTCTWKDLEGVGLSWQVVGFVRDSVYLKRFDAAAAKVHCVRNLLETWGGLSSVAATCIDLPTMPAEDMNLFAEGQGAIEILSFDAVRHVDQNPEHKLVAREHSLEPTFLLDVPVPKLLDMRSRRCLTCAKAGWSNNFKPGPDDVARCVPDIVVRQGSAHSKVPFHDEHLSSLALAEHLCDLQLANGQEEASGFCPDMHAGANSPWSLPGLANQCWRFGSCPAHSRRAPSHRLKGLLLVCGGAS